MLSIFVAGDFVPRRRIKSLVEIGDFRFFDEVLPYTRSADYSIVNLECPILVDKADHINKTGPNLRCERKAVDALKYAGFQAVTLANNHFRDYGQIGVLNTLSSCENVGLKTVGGGRNYDEASKNLEVSKNGKRLTIINACEHEWSIADNDRGGSRPLNPIDIYYDIVNSKKESDYVMVILHGGTEHYNLPTPRMKRLYRFFVDAGADAVVNHHQHCYSGYELYKGKPIFYGLGNFCFDKYKAENNPFWEDGYAVTIYFDEEINFELHPYSQCSEDYCGVSFLEDRLVFNEKLLKLNNIISDDIVLKDAFERMAVGKSQTLKALLAPYSGILLKIMQKGLIPSFVNKQRLQRLLAFVQCESHHDILVEYLKQKVQ